MSSQAISVILNPALPTESVLYTVTPSQQITIQHRPLDQSSTIAYSDNSTAPGGTSITGPVSVPASIAAVLQHGIVNVYGMSPYTPKGATASLNLVCLLSPFVNPIRPATTPEIQTTYGAIAAASDGKHHTTYLYWLKDKTPGVPAIMQAIISDTQVTISQLRGPTPDPTSNLGAEIDPTTGDRYVFYQDTSANISYVNAKTMAVNPLIQTQNAFKAGTSLATTSFVSDGKFNLWIYYQNVQNMLVRNTSMSSSPWSPTILQSPAQLAQDTLITANTDPSGTNHVFYISTNGATNTFDEVLDPIGSPITVEPRLTK